MFAVIMMMAAAAIFAAAFARIGDELFRERESHDDPHDADQHECAEKFCEHETPSHQHPEHEAELRDEISRGKHESD